VSVQTCRRTSLPVPLQIMKVIILQFSPVQEGGGGFLFWETCRSAPVRIVPGGQWVLKRLGREADFLHYLIARLRMCGTNCPVPPYGVFNLHSEQFTHSVEVLDSYRDAHIYIHTHTYIHIHTYIHTHIYILTVNL
jgi:hypothetical protein